VAYPGYIRDKARQLRQTKQLTIDELAACLALPRTTIYYWVRDIPIDRWHTARASAAQRKGCQAMQRKYRLLREEAYAKGRAEFDDLAVDPIFRDFVNLDIAEGYKRSRNSVSINNSDPAVMKLSMLWFRRFADNRIECCVHHHSDQDPGRLRHFWGAELRVNPGAIRVVNKSNSGGLSGRQWRSEHGVLTVRSSDTVFRARLQGWMDRLQEHWLNSLKSGRGAAW
jgi:hypothetical protein